MGEQEAKPPRAGRGPGNGGSGDHQSRSRGAAAVAVVVGVLVLIVALAALFVPPPDAGDVSAAAATSSDAVETQEASAPSGPKPASPKATPAPTGTGHRTAGSETSVPAAGSDDGGAGSRTNQGAGSSPAMELLATLPVKGRAPKTGYSRDEFGQAWEDVDRNGCDTRNDVLARDLVHVVYRNDASCRVISGVLADPYSGQTVDFVRGQGTSQLVPVDHVVALSDAWQKGAQQLTRAQRTLLANDPLNLQATIQQQNSQKSDGDAATWLPRNKAYRCNYVARQVAVKAAYALWVTQAEHDAMARVLGACPDQTASASELLSTPFEAAEASEAAPKPEAQAHDPHPAAPAQPAAPAETAGQAPAPAPARSVNCSDFATHAEAQQWFEYYYPQLGDVGGLDRDGNLEACVSLP